MGASSLRPREPQGSESYLTSIYQARQTLPQTKVRASGAVESTESFRIIAVAVRTGHYQAMRIRRWRSPFPQVA